MRIYSPLLGVNFLRGDALHFNTGYTNEEGRDGIRDPQVPVVKRPRLATLLATVVKGRLMSSRFISSTFDGCAARDTAAAEVEEGGEMISILTVAKPHRPRHGQPIEVIFNKYHHEAAPPRLPLRSAEHPISR
jgi:hypothetical protein